MEPRPLERRIAFVEASTMAHAIALRILIGEMLGRNPEMLAHYEKLANEAVERMYADGGLRTHAHEVLQIALHEIEGLFRPFGSGSGEGTPRADSP